LVGGIDGKLALGVSAAAVMAFGEVVRRSPVHGQRRQRRRTV